MLVLHRRVRQVLRPRCGVRRHCRPGRLLVPRLDRARPSTLARETERERERERVCACVRERERERLCACVQERERESVSERVCVCVRKRVTADATAAPAAFSSLDWTVRAQPIAVTPYVP